MKKIVFSLLITCFLFACSDNDGLIPVVNDPNPIAGEEQELVPVSFNVGFSVEDAPFRSTADNFSAKYLTFVVFDYTTGKYYARFDYENSDGSINELLPEGEYVFIFIANNTKFPFVETTANLSKNTTLEHMVFLNACPYIELGRVDQFYTKFTYSVKKGNENVSFPTLERIVGKIEINIRDATPETTPAIVMETRIQDRYCIPGRTGVDFIPHGMTVTSFWREVYYPTTEGLTISFYSYETITYELSVDKFNSRLYTITLKAMSDPNDDNTIIAEGKIHNVEFIKNKQVRYNGNISQTQSSFTIEVNDLWGETIEEPFGEYTY